ncbi:hypothetical protein FHY55_10605 [Oceanicola sp. D3]|uniref:Tox-REase-5 domain-containing protein n=1 Tax=Oceanicola sp. D3 TaxID=2587163 RepID=UPI0011233A58|nr:Tox-REase-5 domain-containing protein [Oceanicola sp. D3]QDC09666.1 hypothetical protein FHY55_10605 [Oceanicola sp. D3]
MLGSGTFLPFCLPYARPVPGGVEVGLACWGLAPPAPDVEDMPDIEIPGVPGSGETGEIDTGEEGGNTVGPDAPPEEWPEAQPHADVAAEAAEMAEDGTEPCTAGCEECAPTVQGYPDWTNYAPDDAEYVEESSWNGYYYQHMICGLPYNPALSKIVEWKFAAYSWDGHLPPGCVMLEAKYGYGGLLSHTYEQVPTDGGGTDTRYRTIPQPGREWQVRRTFRKLLEQARAQIDKLRPTPEVGLIWSFSHSDSRAYFHERGGLSLYGEWRFAALHIPAPEF